MSAHAIKYRADIDGLRALAIIPVVLFHCWPQVFAGGFVGVDIFFVISGYLITSILISQIADGDFSFKTFYVRRALRLFPALVITFAITLLFSWYILLPHEFIQIGRHVAAGTSFLANVNLFSETGYFNNASEYKPLLHLWSLAIEEQFYFIWPTVLIVTWKFLPKKVPLVVSALCIYSFGINANKIHRDLDAAFFLPQFRFWELLIGGFLASLEQQDIRLKKYNSFWGMVGFALCFASYLLVDRTTIFPGYWALLPCLGAGFLIAAGPTSFVNKSVLSLKPFVYIGLISYPLYLVHWPLFSFNQIDLPDLTGPVSMLNWAIDTEVSHAKETSFTRRNHPAYPHA